MTERHQFWGDRADDLAADRAIAKIAHLILPCPFCGEQPAVLGAGERQRGLMIHCVAEGCANPSVSYYSHETTLRVWNRRNGADGVSEDK